jgi:two-component SAPR family response regulator
VRYSGGRYAFNASWRHDHDVETFEHALAAARGARPASAALPDLQREISACGGDFLADMAAGEWAQARRDELRRSFEAALLAAGRLHAAAGRLQPAVTAFRRAVAHEPLNETAHRELMSSWARLGETARAVQHYRELAAMLPRTGRRAARCGDHRAVPAPAGRAVAPAGPGLVTVVKAR